MANIKISELDAAVSLTGAEFVPIVQSLITKRTSVSAIAGALGIVTTAKLILSSAQILALNSTPIQLVAAQGSNTIIVPLKVLFYEHFVSVAYTTNTALQIAPNTVYSKSFAGELAFTQTQLSTYDYEVNAAGTTPANSINVPINIFATSGNPAAGNGAMEVYLTYAVITL